MILIHKYLWPWGQRTLIWQFARREVLQRNKGSLLGMGWSLLTPLMMLAVYTFVFVGVMRASWPGAESGGGAEFALQIFAGLTVFNLFAELAARAPRLVLEQPNLVKKVVFPLELLPWITLWASLFHAGISFLVLAGVTLAVRGSLPVTVLSLPLVLLPLLPFLLGLSWILASLGVFVRDIAPAMGLVVSLTMFLSPIFYPASALPSSVGAVLMFNPLALIIENVRRVVLQGLWPEWAALALYSLIAIVFSIVAAKFFDATRKGFADVL